MRRHLLERKHNPTTLTPARDIVTACNRRYTQYIQPEKWQTGTDNPLGSYRHTSLPCTCTFTTSKTNSTKHNQHINNYQHVFQPTVPSGPLRVGCITQALQTAVRHLRLDRQGIRPSDVSSHSLRPGGATAMHLNNIPNRTIQKMGRWSSDTFLIYIHEQIAAFSRGVSKQMELKVNFKNIRRSIEPINSPELHTTLGLAQN
jgi:hypothetical protein